jgi:uncharacterized protein
MMTWDEDKRAANLKKHGVDFNELESVFDFPMVTCEDDRVAYGEMRLQSYAWLKGRVVFLVWTERGENPHLISCRYADKYETKKYFENTSV